MRKNLEEGNLGEDLIGAFLTFQNSLIISGMLMSSYGAGQACARGVQGVQPPYSRGERMIWRPRTLSG